MSRPEDNLPPDLYYNDTTAQKYTSSSRITSIQAEMTHRALSLLSLPHPSLLLDIGCGSGLSGEILSSTGSHIWIGMDISSSMLGIALERDVDGDLMLADIGQGIPFRPGTFDGAISISAIQWLCATPSSHPNDTPNLRLRRFFDGLYASLKRGARAVCQFYPANVAQRTMITSAAIRAGFGAGLLVDQEGTKNEKMYLVLTVGEVSAQGGHDITTVVAGMDNVDVDARPGAKGRRNTKRKDGKDLKGSKAWILKKKEQMEAKGKVVKSSSKYTGRKRRIAF